MKKSCEKDRSVELTIRNKLFPNIVDNECFPRQLGASLATAF